MPGLFFHDPPSPQVSVSYPSRFCPPFEGERGEGATVLRDESVGGPGGGPG